MKSLALATKFERTETEGFMKVDLSKVKLKILQEASKGVLTWDSEKCDEIELLYKCWMICADKYKDEIPFIPNKNIDIFWHFHILHTKQYMDDCYKYFGRYVHHNPHLVETSEMKENRAKSKEIFLRELGVTDIDIEWASCWWQPDEDESGECSSK